MLATSPRRCCPSQHVITQSQRHARALQSALFLRLLLLGAAAKLAASSMDVRLQLGPYYFNPSVVEYQGEFLATARSAFMKGVAGRWWWFNEGYLCRSQDAGFSSPSCGRFDPWAGRLFKECLWKGLVDTRGIEDPKLFVWPGRGVFALFNRKPSRAAAAGANGLCRPGEPWLMPFLSTVVAEPGAGQWALPEPLELRVDIPFFYYEQQQSQVVIKEKNWGPFVWRDKLFVVHSISPRHRVLRLSPDGRATQQYVSDSRRVLGQFEGQELHGGPPLVLLPPHHTTTISSSSKAGTYLGVIHYFVWQKQGGRDTKEYHHHFYKVKASPPFAVCAVSREMPLVFRTSLAAAAAAGQPGQDKTKRIWKDTSRTAYASGLFLYISGSAPQLFLSYGSGDTDARLLVISLAQMESLFDAHDCAPDGTAAPAQQ